jgi:4-diphosphocytidyl-2-C-methyl-D-erythritol kinase
MTQLVAPAKLTWSLHVLGRRDDGLHLLDAEMMTIDVADSIELAETDDVAARFSVRTAPPATPRDADLGDGELVTRALELVGRRAHVAITKRIPIGAGLGGGSADAAAVLRWAGEHDPLVAVRLGADVPFCCIGGRCAVRGVGEVLEPLEVLARTVTLALPPVRVDTAACYRAYDELPERARHHPRNDLTAAAEVVAPELADVRRLLEVRTEASFMLAGSGSTLYCEGDPLGLGRDVGQVLETRGGPVRLVVARTMGPSA